MIYLDNAATSFPKPPGVSAAMSDTLRRVGGNPGRSGHRLSLEAGRLVLGCREALAKFFAAENPFSFVFTGNCTQALNLAIFGLVRPKSHVISTVLEHNSTLRPLTALQAQQGIRLTLLAPDEQDRITPDALQKAIRPDTSLVIINHVSNVTGIIQDAAALAQICHARGVPMLLDAAQSAGLLDIRLNQPSAPDLMAIPGHKGLYGPQGTGALYIREGLLPNPLVYGGTGSQSHLLEQPLDLPDRYESGTLNTPGLAGLAQGIAYASAHRPQLLARENALIARCIHGLSALPGVRLLGGASCPRAGAVSFTLKGIPSAQVVDMLDTRYSIACRGGLHCAPLVHRHYGTLETGAVRASVGAYNRPGDIDALLVALGEIIKGRSLEST